MSSAPRSVVELRALASDLDKSLIFIDTNAADRQRSFLQLALLQQQELKARHLHANPTDQEKNRYKDVIPYDDARVVLEGGRYINASEIWDDQSHSGAVASCSPPYIACQGPLSNTSEDFWDMVVERQIEDIVMLTGCVENGREKCFPYYTDGATFGKHRVVCTKQSSLGGVEVRDLEIQTRVSTTAESSADTSADSSADTGADKSARTRSHRVRHHQLMTWPDHGVPTCPEVLDPLLDVLYYNTKAGRTTVVHCSAGIGRSGVLIALSMLIERIRRILSRDMANTMGHRNGNGNGGGPIGAEMAKDGDERLCSFVDIVCCMRRQRAGMVQTQAQYSFCEDAGRRLMSMLSI